MAASFDARGLSIEFLDDLHNAIDDFDATVTAEDTSEAHKAASTGGVADAAKRLIANGHKLDSIVRIKYAASHLEKALKPATPPALTP